MRSARRPPDRDHRVIGHELGWDEQLFQRIEALQVPRSMVDSWLRFNQSADRTALAIDRYEQATFGSLRLREATAFDDEKLAELFRATPERIGGWEVTVERSPYVFAQFRLQENPQIQVLEEEGELLAAISRSTRRSIVGGIRLNVRYTGGLRVHPLGRGRGLSHYVRWFESACGPYTTADYYYFRSKNYSVLDWILRDNPGRLDLAPSREDDIPGIPVAVHYVPATLPRPTTTGIRRVHSDDLQVCVDIINSTHDGQDLFRPYTIDFFEERMNDGGWGPRPSSWVPLYGWNDHWVLEESGRIVACAGLWDRGRNIRERWRHRENGTERVREVTAMLDFGYIPGRPDAMAQLIEYLVWETQQLGRTHLLAPLQQLPEVANLLTHLRPMSETWSMQWEHFPPDDSGQSRLAITTPYTDLVYW